jgi:hypothetical protein
MSLEECIDDWEDDEVDWLTGEYTQKKQKLERAINRLGGDNVGEASS